MTAVIIVAHFLDDRIIGKYESVRKALGPSFDLFLVVQSDNPGDLVIPRNVRMVTYSYGDLCGMGYPALCETVVPGSPHFVLLRFYHGHKKYDYYWNIEYDVEFDGDWKILFDTCSRCDTDFITCDIQDFDQNPTWYWWRALVLNGHHVPILRRTRSFNPIYRASSRALELLCDRQSQGDGGHFEVLLPTLFKANGLTMGDLNRSSRYALPGLRRDFYDKRFPEPLGSMRHTPSFPRSVLTGKSNLLFHPVKD